LVYKTAADSLSIDEVHCAKYKAPIYLLNFSYRLGSVLFLYCIVYYSFLLGDPLKVFSIGEHGHRIEPTATFDVPSRYELLYKVEKP